MAYPCFPYSYRNTAFSQSKLTFSKCYLIISISASQMKISSIQQLRDVVVDRPDVLRLYCEVVGQPKPTFQWEKDSKLLQESARVTITEEGFVSTLEVTKSDFEDSGLYTCTAVNDFGRVSTSCIARVRGELY